ncbi:apolipoprotein N-acyltransferase [Roseovarius sp. E0-M6]|uniref:apolipoprotein N-acyltransferase n=1 Tax=Roseovarius sp. E0-M6 TaxID=3127118 RepID=UPI00300FC503
MTEWRLRWLALFCGIVMGAGQAPLSLWWLALAGLVGLLWVLGRDAIRTRVAFWRGWFGGVGYFAATHFWIVDPFFVDAVRHGWMAPFAIIGLAAGMALIWGAATALARWSGGVSRAWLLLLVPALTLGELFRAYALTGFPWAPIGSVWLETPLAQLASVVGVHGLTLLSLALIAGPLACTGRMRAGVSVLALAVVGGLWVWGAGRVADTPAPTDRIVRIVQPNAPQHLKWHPDYMPVFFNRALDFTAAAAEGTKQPDMIVWPETSVPSLLGHADNLLTAMDEAAGGVPLVFGVQRNIGPLYYNSLAANTETGLQVYDKRHLVPFGEYVPYGDVLSELGITHLASAQGYGYAPGPEGQPLIDLGPLGKGLPLICYEGIFPHDLRGFEGRADWIVLVTNDAWFGKLTMPYMHLDHGRMRAIETGLPMIRAANTGISAMIDARGQVTARIGLGETGFLDTPLPATLPRTVYAKNGDWPVLTVALLSLLVGFFISMSYRRRLRD